LIYIMYDLELPKCMRVCAPYRVLQLFELFSLPINNVQLEMKDL